MRETDRDARSAEYPKAGQDLEGKAEGRPAEMRSSTRIPGLAPSRVAEIRRRLEDGTYASAAMADEVARRLIARGEL